MAVPTPFGSFWKPGAGCPDCATVGIFPAGTFGGFGVPFRTFLDPVWGMVEEATIARGPCPDQAGAQALDWTLPDGSDFVGDLVQFTNKYVSPDECGTDPSGADPCPLEWAPVCVAPNPDPTDDQSNCAPDYGLGVGCNNSASNCCATSITPTCPGGAVFSAIYGGCFPPISRTSCPGNEYPPPCKKGDISDPSSGCCSSQRVPPPFCPPPGVIDCTSGTCVCKPDPPLPSIDPLGLIPGRSGTTLAFSGVALTPRVAARSKPPRFSRAFLALNPTLRRGVPYVFSGCGCGGVDSDAEEEELITQSSPPSSTESLPSVSGGP